MTLQQRIAALNASHINRVPGDAPPTRPKPPIASQRPVITHQSRSVNNPPENVTGSVAETGIGNLPNDTHADQLPPPPLVRNGVEKSKPPPPPLPKRLSTQTCPALPPRRPTDPIVRRDSSESTSSVLSSVSGTSVVLSRSKSRESFGRVKAPAWRECELPPLPARPSGPTQRKSSAGTQKYHIRAPSAGPLKVSPTRQNESQEEETGPRPSMAPRLPARRQTDHCTDISLRLEPLAASLQCQTQKPWRTSNAPLCHLV